jgi:hypothetical protein
MMQRYTHVVETIRDDQREIIRVEIDTHTHMEARVEGKDREECTRGHISMMMMTMMIS